MSVESDKESFEDRRGRRRRGRREQLKEWQEIAVNGDMNGDNSLRGQNK